MGNLAGKALPCTAGPPITGFKNGSGIWQVLEGIPTEASANAVPHPGQSMYRSFLVYKYDKKQAAGANVNQAGKPEVPPAELDAAKNAIRRLKMLRHPYVLRFIEGGETDDAILFVTEPAIPLSAWLEANKPGDDGSPGPAGTKKADFDSACVWGVYTLVTALNFLASCDLLHGNVSTDSVFVTKGGDWKLGGFDTCVETTSSAEFPDPWFRQNDASGPCAPLYKAPERAAGDWGALKAAPRTALDAYSLGVVLLEAFGHDVLRSSGDIKSAGEGLRGNPAFPAPLRPIIARLLSAAPKSRPSFADILGSEYFRHPLVGTLLFLDELALKEPTDKARFFKSLPALLPKVPDSTAKYRILPALMTALEYGAAGGGGTVVLAPILDIGSRLPPEEYASSIVPCVVRLFASSDRATRVQLLHHLPSYIEKLSDEIVNGTVITNVLGGFADTNGLLREATVKACLHLAPRMTPVNMHGQMLRALKARLGDSEPAIRVNTTICLGRVAQYVTDPREREDSLLPCFLREMRDPFPHARAAALKAVAHTLHLSDGAYWSVDTLSKKLMTAACYCATDPFADARASAFLVLEGGMAILRGLSDKRAEEDAAREAAGGAAAGSAADGSLSVGGEATGSVGGAAAATLPGAAASFIPAAAAGAVGAMFGTLGWAMSTVTSRILPTGPMEAAAAAAAGAAAQQPSTPTSIYSPPSVTSAPSAAAGPASLPRPASAADGWGDDLDVSSGAPPVRKTASKLGPARARGASSKAGGDGDEEAAPKPARVRPQRPVKPAVAAASVEPASGGGEGWGNDGWDSLDKAASSATGKGSSGGLVLSAGAPEPAPAAGNGGWGGNDDLDLLADIDDELPKTAPRPAAAAPAPTPATGPSKGMKLGGVAAGATKVSAAPAPAPSGDGDGWGNDDW